ncbi:MAG: hypothetical protein QW412_01490 [Candidatus Aenigmatarchaeota archaeon]
MSLDKKIISEISNYMGVEYSEIRKKFEHEPSFLERLCFLITTGEVFISGYVNKKTLYPEEIALLYKTQSQYYSEPLRIVRVEEVRNVVYEFLTTGKLDLSRFKSPDEKEYEPVLTYRPNWLNLIKRLGRKWSLSL